MIKAAVKEQDSNDRCRPMCFTNRKLENKMTPKFSFFILRIFQFQYLLPTSVADSHKRFTPQIKSCALDNTRDIMYL